MAKFFCRAQEKAGKLSSTTFDQLKLRTWEQSPEKKKIQQKKENYANFFSATAADLV